MFYNGQGAQDKVFLSPQLFSSSFFIRLSAHNLMSCNSICKRGVHATIESLRNNLQRAMAAIATSWFDSVHLKATLLAVSVLINLFLIRLPSQWSPSAGSIERKTFPMTLCALSKLTFFRFHSAQKTFHHIELCVWRADWRLSCDALSISGDPISRWKLSTVAARPLDEGNSKSLTALARRSFFN